MATRKIIEVKGIRALVQKFDNLLDNFEKDMKDESREIAKIYNEKYIKPAIPKDTGALRFFATYKVLDYDLLDFVIAEQTFQGKAITSSEVDGRYRPTRNGQKHFYANAVESQQHFYGRAIQRNMKSLLDLYERAMDRIFHKHALLR